MRTGLKLTVLLPLGILFYALAQDATTAGYTVTSLVTNATDRHLINPWGLSRPSSASAADAFWWTADNITGFTTLYSAGGAVQPLAIAIPSASGTGPGSPTGTAFNSLNFTFATLDGTISNWYALTQPATPGQGCAQCHVTTTTIMVNHSAAGASYTGLTMAMLNGAPVYYAANTNGGVEAYDASFQPVSLSPGAFVDPNVPVGFTPFGIQSIGGNVFVTFVQPNATTGGFVDEFSPTGTLLFSLQNGIWMKAPWGVVQAPSGFGVFSSAILVSMNGNGTIGAFSPTTGAFLGLMRNAAGRIIALPNLWAIDFGAGNTDSGPANVLYFNLGGRNQSIGVFGKITAN